MHPRLPCASYPGEGLEHHERDGGGSLDKVRGTHHGAILHAVPVGLEVPEAPLDLPVPTRLRR